MPVGPAMSVPQMVAGVLAILLNILTLAIFRKTRSVKSTTVYLIAYLAISDLCLGMCIVIRSSLVLAGQLSWNSCTLLLDVILTSAGGSLTAILMMHLEVYFSVKFATNYRQIFTKMRVLVIIVVSVLLWTLVGGLGYYSSKDLTPDLSTEIEKSCFPHAAFKSAYLIGLCSTYLVIFVLILVIQISILRLFQVHRARVQEQVRRPSVFTLASSATTGLANTATKSTWIKKKLSLGKLLTVVLLLFVICWYPYIIATLIYNACEECHFSTDVLSHLGSLILLHGVLNIFVYVAKCQEFRVVLKRYVCYFCLKNSVSPSSST